MDGASTGALPTRAPLMPSRMLVGTTCSCGRHITWLCECGAVASGRRFVVRYRTPQHTQTKKRGFKTKRDAEAFAATVEVEKMTGPM